LLLLLLRLLLLRLQPQLRLLLRQTWIAAGQLLLKLLLLL
jgi:hypothetical protein